MKLNETVPYLESSGELEEQFFGIQDQGMLFDILRKKMYSNPILAICREISCNARDAHREVGCQDVAVQIHLPNNLEPYYKIRDFGPGISPDRMSNVFIKYTASTKRSDNLQTGGFGLGAKTPFSYSDSFSIITVHNGIKYNYNCVIDETKVGKLMLTSQSPTKEKNGTEIMIPVLPKNFNEFATYTEQACRHWDVKPLIKGGTINWQTNSFILQGDNWAIATAPYGGNRTAKMIIDGIEYPLDLTALRNYADTKLIDAASGSFVLYFNVGELSLSASRESIYLDERTQTIIRNRLDLIRDELRAKAVEKIDAFTNLWDANVYYNKGLRKAFNNVGFLGALTWQGIALNDNTIYVDTVVYTFTRGKHSRKYGTDPDKLSRGHGNHIRFEENTELYFNDLGLKEPTPRHVKKAFDNDKALNTLHVISPGDKVTRAMLDKKIHLDKMNVKILSDITKASGRAYTAPAQRVLLFKFDPRASSFRQVSYASVDEDNTHKVLCFLHKDTYTGVRQATLKGKDFLDWHSLKTLLSKFPNHTFYGVDVGTSTDRIKEDFSDFEDVQVFIKDKVFGNKKIDYVQIKFASVHQHDVDEKFLRILDKMEKLVKNPNSLYFKRLALHTKLKEINKIDSGLLPIYESVNGTIDDAALKAFAKEHPELDIMKINSMFDEKYPLLSHIHSYNYAEISKDLAQYINLADKETQNV